MPEPQLVDPYGRPVSTAAMQAEQPPRRSTRAPPAFNPDPDKLNSLFKKADSGDPRELQQLTAEIESRDGHIGGVLETRRKAAAKLPWRAEAVSDDDRDVAIADAVQRDILNARWFKGMVRNLLDAVVKGWSVCSMRWSLGDVWRPSELRWVDQQMTAVDPADDQRLAWRDPTDESKLQPIAPFTAVVHTASEPSGPLYRRGMGRSLSILYSLKRIGVQTWASFVEMYGVARPVASFPLGAKESDLEEFEALLQTWAHGGYLLKPSNLRVEFPEPASAGRGSGEPVHAALAKYCDEQASKRIIGQTMTSDTGASRAQAEVHERVAGWVIEADAGELAETIMRDIVEPYVRLNFGMDVAMPRVYAVIESSERRAFQLTVLEKLVPLGLRVEQSVARDLGGFPEPAEGAEVLSGTGAAAPAGATRRRGGAGLDRLRVRLAQLLAQRATFSEDDEDLVDRDAGADAEANWKVDLQPFADQVDDMADAASGFDDFLRRLTRATVNGDKLVRHLASTSMKLRGVGDGTDEVD